MEKVKLTALFTVLILLLIFWGIFYLISQSSISKLKPAEKFEEGLPAKEFNITSSGDFYPRFSKASFKPGEVTTGDSQIITVWLEDPTGIKIVKAEIKTDLQKETIDLKFIEGDDKKGAWQSQWHVCGFQKEDYYPVIFKAQSLGDKENTVTIYIKNKGYE